MERRVPILDDRDATIHWIETIQSHNWENFQNQIRQRLGGNFSEFILYDPNGIVFDDFESIFELPENFVLTCTCTTETEFDDWSKEKHLKELITSVHDEKKIGMTTRKTKFDVFLSHDWGKEKKNHLRVVNLAKKLSNEGLRVWIDEEKLQGGGTLDQLLSEGIDNSFAVIICITDNYMNKLIKTDTSDNCSAEFNYTISTKSKFIIPVVTEKEMLDTSTWRGPLGMRLVNQMYIEFVDDNEIDNTVSNILKAYSRMVRAEEGKISQKPKQSKELTPSEIASLKKLTKDNNIDGVKNLLGSGLVSNIDEPYGDQNYTALHHAAYHGRIEILETLLDAGANVFVRNKKNESVIDAALAGKKENAKDFIENYIQYKIGHSNKKPLASEFKSDDTSGPVVSKREVFVRYLPKSIDKNQLLKHFRGCGEFKIKFTEPKNRDEGGTKHAHLLFESSAAASTAINLMHKKMIGGREIVVQQQIISRYRESGVIVVLKNLPSTIKTEEEFSKKFPNLNFEEKSFQAQKHNNKTIGFLLFPPTSFAEAAIDQINQINNQITAEIFDDSNQVFFKNLPPTLKEGEFRKYLPLTELAYVQFLRENNRYKLGLVTFSSAEDASRTIELLNKKSIEGFEVLAEEYSPKKAKSNKQNSNKNPNLDDNNKDDQTENQVILKNLPTTMTTDSLTTLFSGLTISEVHFFKEKPDQPYQHARLSFASTEDAETAIMLVNEQQIEGRTIKAEIYDEAN